MLDGEFMGVSQSSLNRHSISRFNLIANCDFQRKGWSSNTRRANMAMGSCLFSQVPSYTRKYVFIYFLVPNSGESRQPTEQCSSHMNSRNHPLDCWEIHSSWWFETPEFAIKKLLHSIHTIFIIHVSLFSDTTWSMGFEGNMFCLVTCRPCANHL